LAILAIVSLIEFLMIAAVGLLAFKAYKQMMTVVENVERMHIAPVRARVDAILDEVEVITGRVKHAQDSVASALHTAATAGSVLAGTVKSKTWPIISVIKGVRMAATAVLDRNGKKAGSDRPYITAGL
jgi:predicted PurR-regulated permease PerM